MLPSSAISIAMGISGAMDPTLISLGISVTGVLSIAQGKSVNETIAPLNNVLKLDSNPNGITAPILEAVTCLINNIGNLGPNSIKNLLNSLFINVKPIFTVTQSLSTNLESNDLKTFVKVYAGALYAVSRISATNDQKVIRILLTFDLQLLFDRFIVQSSH